MFDGLISYLSKYKLGNHPGWEQFLSLYYMKYYTIQCASNYKNPYFDILIDWFSWQLATHRTHPMVNERERERGGGVGMTQGEGRYGW